MTVEVDVRGRSAVASAMCPSCMSAEVRIVDKELGTADCGNCSWDGVYGELVVGVDEIGAEPV